MLEKEILHLDNHLLVVNKPAGITTQEDALCPVSLEKMAKEWIRKKFDKPGNVFLQPIHRLDRPVSGIVVFARTSKALSRLSETIRQKKCTKIYHGHVEGILPSAQGTLQHYLEHQEHYAKIVSSIDREAKYCELYYSLLKKSHSSSLVEIELITGRYHQIRAQFAEIGHPIIGDYKYGSEKSSYDPQAICLHHRFFQIPHPILGNLIQWEAPYPDLWPAD